MRRLLIAVLLVAVAIAVWQLMPEATDSHAAHSAVVTPTGARNPSAIGTPRHASTIDATPLPPANAPLAEVADSLRAAAAAGNGAAACRLAMELIRCRVYRYDLESLKNRPLLPETYDARQRAQIEQMHAATQQRVARIRSVCEGVPDGSDREAWRLLFEAAKRGHVPSMTKFGMRTGLSGMGGGDEFDLEGFAAYRMYALQFLTDAAAAGDGRAYLALGEEHLRPNAGTRAIPYDPVRGLGYMKALARNAAGVTRNLTTKRIQEVVTREKISAADQLRADVLAEDLEAPLRKAAPIELAAHPDLENARPETACAGSQPAAEK